ncbi:MAG: TIM barrel protein [Blastocatellia bacterium]
MAIKIGTAPVSWGVMEVSGWGGQQSYESVLDEMRQAGYDGTELGPYDYFPSDPGRLTTELSARGLELVAAFVPIPLADAGRHEAGFAEAMRTAELLSKSGARLIVLADEMSAHRQAVAGRVDDSLDGPDGLNDEQWAAAARILARVARACRELGLDSVFHHHAATYVETPSEIERLCAEVDAELLGLCLDTGHYQYGGGDPLEAVRKHGSRIRHLHLKDIRPAVLDAVRRDGVDFLEAVRRDVFCELGEGAVDFPRVISELTAAGFDGWAIVEQDTDATKPGVRPVESAIRSRLFLRDRIGL